MDPLEKISYRLAAIDYIPIVNIPSGIIHLICGIRGKTVGSDKQFVDAEFKNLTLRKLDNWSHLKKSLAILSVVGTFFMIKKRIDIAFEFGYVEGALHDGPGGVRFSLNTIPKRLLLDKEWLNAASHDKKKFFPTIFSKLNVEFRGNKKWVLDLIDRGAIYSGNFENLTKELQLDPDVVLKMLQSPDGENVFAQLAPHLKDDSQLATVAFDKVFSKFGRDTAAEKIVKYISDKTILMSKDSICLTAVESGSIAYNELNDTRKTDIEFCVAAVKSNHRQWAELSSSLQKNAQLLIDLRAWFKHGLTIGYHSKAGSWVKALMMDRDWFKQYWAKRKEQQMEMVLFSDDTNSFEYYFLQE